VSRFARVAICIALGLGGVLTALQAWQAWRANDADLGTGPIGSLHSVMLTNGQVYYGTLLDVARNRIVLGNVYYVEVATDPKTAERSNRLVSRRASDWHAPTRMSIPIDKIVIIELVGPDSRVAKGIEQDHKDAASKP
jgi:hypothetical protein